MDIEEAKRRKEANNDAKEAENIQKTANNEIEKIKNPFKIGTNELKALDKVNKRKCRKIVGKCKNEVIFRSEKSCPIIRIIGHDKMAYFLTTPLRRGFFIVYCICFFHVLVKILSL